MNQQVRDQVRPESPRESGVRASRTEVSSPRNARKGSGRESIESFVVVFVSFLIWSLEAEGFVIPTGSMAPTLMGRHKEIVCPQCGYTYTVNADREVELDRPSRGHGPTGRVGYVRELPFRVRRRRCAELLGRPHLRDEGRPLAAVLERGGPGQARSLGRGRLQAARRARGPLHQAAGRHAQRGDPDRRRRPLGQAAGPVRGRSSGCSARSSTSRPCS